MIDVTLRVSVSAEQLVRLANIAWLISLLLTR
jgi:hypothetical protein